MVRHHRVVYCLAIMIAGAAITSGRADQIGSSLRGGGGNLRNSTSNAEESEQRELAASNNDPQEGGGGSPVVTLNINQVNKNCNGADCPTDDGQGAATPPWVAGDGDDKDESEDSSEDYHHPHHDYHPRHHHHHHHHPNDKLADYYYASLYTKDYDSGTSADNPNQDLINHYYNKGFEDGHEAGSSGTASGEFEEFEEIEAEDEVEELEKEGKMKKKSKKQKSRKKKSKKKKNCKKGKKCKKDKDENEKDDKSSKEVDKCRTMRCKAGFVCKKSKCIKKKKKNNKDNISEEERTEEEATDSYDSEEEEEESDSDDEEEEEEAGDPKPTCQDMNCPLAYKCKKGKCIKTINESGNQRYLPSSSSRAKYEEDVDTKNNIDIPIYQWIKMYYAMYFVKILYNDEKGYKIQDHLDDMKGHNDISLDLLKYWETDYDQSLVVKVTGLNACYGVFAGTVGLTDVTNKGYAGDWATNMVPGYKKVNGCKVRKGFYDAYYNINGLGDGSQTYEEEFRATLEQCMTDCPDCEMILTGKSQGGGIAVAAGLIYQELQYDPLVVTFGGPKAFEPSNACKGVFKKDKLYRFITVFNWQHGNAYDFVSMMASGEARHYGNAILLSNKDSFIVSALPYNDDKVRHAVSRDAHHKDVYIKEMKKITEMAVDAKKPILTITRRHNQDYCGYGDECTEGRCEGLLPPYVCRSKLGHGKDCNENSDCESQKCVFFAAVAKPVCALPNGKRKDGAKCLLDSDCDSGRCELDKGQKCHARKEKGSSCNEDSDCISRNCKQVGGMWSTKKECK